MRRKAKVDSNQPEITAALRKIGCSVTPTHTIGKGFPDLAVGFRGRNYFFEIKDGSLSPSRRSLTKDEADWHESWRGQVHIIGSVDQALRFIQENAPPTYWELVNNSGGSV